MKNWTAYRAVARSAISFGHETCHMKSLKVVSVPQRRAVCREGTRNKPGRCTWCAVERSRALLVAWRPQSVILHRQSDELARRQMSGRVLYIRDADMAASPMVVDAGRHEAQHSSVEADSDVPTGVHPTPGVQECKSRVQTCSHKPSYHPFVNRAPPLKSHLTGKVSDVPPIALASDNLLIIQ